MLTTDTHISLTESCLVPIKIIVTENKLQKCKGDWPQKIISFHDKNLCDISGKLFPTDMLTLRYLEDF